MNQSERTAIKQAVYDIVRMIPRGRATSYGAIARAVGYPNMSRLVGRIMGEASCESDTIPAHRVVNNQGLLSGKNAFITPDKMQKCLEAEGIIVVNDKIQNWKHIFWNPIEEIQL